MAKLNELHLTQRAYTLRLRGADPNDVADVGTDLIDGHKARLATLLKV